MGRCGAKIGICGTGKEKLDRAVEQLTRAGVKAFGAVCDVADSGALSVFAGEVEKNLGAISIWVSNAAVYPQYTLLNTPENIWQRTIDVNMKSVFLGGKIALNKMRNSGGVLLNASSFAARMPSVGSGLYAAVKAAVSSMTQTLAAELAPWGIRVCGYAPGVIDTDITHPLIEAGGETMKKTIPMRRFGSSEEAGNVIAFLASDYASYISGVTVEINGGKYCVQNPDEAWTSSGDLIFGGKS
jgi:NAD(P)-dependent dehydrogenase (short-subunit alcohol dehydrogenase family)